MFLPRGEVCSVWERARAALPAPHPPHFFLLDVSCTSAPRQVGLMLVSSPEELGKAFELSPDPIVPAQKPLAHTYCRALGGFTLLTVLQSRGQGKGL